MFLMRDQFLWGHPSRVCDISCCFCYVNVTISKYSTIDFITKIVGMVKCSGLEYTKQTSIYEDSEFQDSLSLIQRNS